MDKYEFINRLDRALEGLSPEEKNSALSYYKELFEDAGSGKEQELISNLGSPEAVAENIIRESGMISAERASEDRSHNAEETSAGNGGKPEYREKKRSASTILLIIVLLIITFPVWIGVVAAVGGILIAVIAVVFALLFAAAAAGIALFAAGVATIFSSVGAGIVLLGLGLLFVGIGIVLLAPLCSAVIKLCVWIFNGIIKLIRSIFCTREVVA